MLKKIILLTLFAASFIVPIGMGESIVKGETMPLPCPSGKENLPASPLNQEMLSIPSLWLEKQQFGGKLLTQWFVDADNPQWVVLIVNRQIWSLLDYLERYRFVNQFGVSASDYQYNLRICLRQGGAPLASYSCEFNSHPLQCKLTIDTGTTGLRGNQRRF